MLTVREALKLPILERATLVAGINGQDRVIRRVHIVDFPGATFEWAKGGELLLTTGFGLLDDISQQEALVPRLVARGLVGLVLSVGHYLTAAPTPIREAGNRLDFPIIELPPDISFVDVTEALFSRIVSEYYAIRERAAETQRTLHALVLEGGTLQNLAETLASFLERSIVIENEAFEVLATFQVGTADGARTRSLMEGRSPPDLANRLIERGIYRQLLEIRGPMHVPAMPDLEMTMERIVAPIIVAHQIKGFMWVIAGERELTDLDELTLEHAATVAALIMYKEDAVHQAEMTLRGDFLEQLFNVTDARDSTLIEQAQQLGFYLDLDYQVLVAHEAQQDESLASNLVAAIEEWIGPIYPALVVPRGTRAVIVLQGHHIPDGGRIARMMVEVLHEANREVLVGIGRAVDDLAGLRDSYNQAVEAVEIALIMGQTVGVRSFDALGVLHWLRHLTPKLLRENIFLNAIHRLAEYDAHRHHHLLLTLETYLDIGNVQDVAARLHVHRNTLSYRLERIEQMLDLDLSDPVCRMNLHVALKSYRLRNSRSNHV